MDETLVHTGRAELEWFTDTSNYKNDEACLLPDSIFITQPYFFIQMIGFEFKVSGFSNK